MRGGHQRFLPTAVLRPRLVESHAFANILPHPSRTTSRLRNSQIQSSCETMASPRRTVEACVFSSTSLASPEVGVRGTSRRPLAYIPNRPRLWLSGTFILLHQRRRNSNAQNSRPSSLARVTNQSRRPTILRIPSKNSVLTRSRFLCRPCKGTIFCSRCEAYMTACCEWRVVLLDETGTG